nr:MAG TPA: hypothetical protein [Caudoviricetes sp.]
MFASSSTVTRCATRSKKAARSHSPELALTSGSLSGTQSRVQRNLQAPDHHHTPVVAF